MFTTFAHLGTHTMEAGEEMSDIEHCWPIIVGAGVIIAILLGVIAYLLSAWQPKKKATSAKKKVTK